MLHKYLHGKNRVGKIKKFFFFKYLDKKFFKKLKKLKNLSINKS